jgi:AcrR family transcriptional regulator
VGTQDRRRRDVAVREKLFVDKAWELIRRDGLLQLQMARVAEACDYAIGTLYQHFSSKEDLLVALMTEHLRERADLFERVARWQAPSRERMFGIAIADTVFVSRNPDYFRLEQYAHTEVVWAAASPARRQAHLNVAAPLGSTVLGIVEDALRCGDLPPQEVSAQELATGFWCLCVGMHTLVHAEGVLQQHNVHEPYSVLARHVQWHLNALDWKPILNPVSDAAIGSSIVRLKKELFHDCC